MSGIGPGARVGGRYVVLEEIGRGGMGLIYLARHEGAAAFLKPVVVKRATPELLAKEASLKEAMGREARIMGRIGETVDAAGQHARQRAGILAAAQVGDISPSSESTLPLTAIAATVDTRWRARAMAIT